MNLNAWPSHAGILHLAAQALASLRSQGFERNQLEQFEMYCFCE